MNATLDILAGGLLLLAAAHALLVGGAAVGLRRALRRSPRAPQSDPPFVTVIVPARDESSVIEQCLTRIFDTDYPEDRFEVIVVDDLSDDATPTLVTSYAERLHRRVRMPVAVLADGSDEEPEMGEERLKLLQMPENLERTRAHKKRAIEKGVEYARGEVILTTDADCLVPPGWIRTMAACFDDIDLDSADHRVTAFVSGPVLYRVEDSPLMRMQALEFLGLVAFGAGVIGLGYPVTCNGANVAYRKDVFHALGGFAGIDHLTSGDDELLMQKVARETPHRVRFCSTPDAAVETDGIRTVRGFISQRRRWASKGMHYPSAGLVASLAVVYLFHVVLVAAAIGAAFWPALAPAVGVAFAVDLVAGFALAGQAAVHFGRARLLAWLLPTEILRLPYFVAIGIAGAFGGFEWKGRRVSR